jgi:hypothetical protein
MKLPKILYVNLIIFFIFFIVAFAIGFFVMKNIGALPVSAQETAKDTVPPAISNVKVAEVSATSSTITWDTDELSDSLINYGLDKNYGIVRDPRADKTSHAIVIDDLAPGTDYFFRITSADGSGNQGISNDFTFKTALQKKEGETDVHGLTQETGTGNGPSTIKTGDAGLSVEGVNQILSAIENITSEQVLEKVIEKTQAKAQEIIAPPTIILDYADVEVGTDYAIITWKTDKESNTIVALAQTSVYDAAKEDPYAWREGNPDEMAMEHRVEITGLTPSTEYHFQVSSKSALGLTGKSTDKVFKTKSIKPEIYNLQITKIQETSATIRWTTNIPCTAIIEYTNLNNNDTKLEGNSTYITVHSQQLNNLIFDTYYSVIVTVESEDGEKTISDPMTFITTRDEVPPSVLKVTTESTIYPGSDNKIQTVASWRTDELAKCQMFYHQGLVLLDEPFSLPKDEDFGIKHVQVATNFLPASVYKFWIICEDEAGNSVKSEDFSMLTPSQEESIIDIIIKNFEASFGWVGKMKGG